MTIRRLQFAAAVCLTLAAASLLIAHEPVYDAWAWLAWGRELAHFDLDTTSGPSWKPLPVALLVPLSLAGDAAPELWLVFVRAAWLMSLVLAAELAFVLTSGRERSLRIAAGAFAAVGLALLRDDVTAWGRQAAGGMSEPLLVALVLGAVRAGIAGATRPALVLGALAALVRPEAWPLLALYGLWCWRADPRARALAVALAVGVPMLWIAPVLLGAGGGGAARAQTATSDPLEALGWALVLPAAVAWPLAMIGLRDRAARPRVLAAGAIGWIAVVAAMTVIGFPGLPRFMAPAAAIVSVLGGVGLATALVCRRAHGMRTALVLVVAGLAATAIGFPGRAADLPRGWQSSARISDSHDRLRTLVRMLGRKRLLACGRLATSDVLVRTALAYELGVPLSEVVSFGTRPRRSGAFVIGLQASPGLREDIRAVATLVGQADEWRVYSLDCPATATATPSASAPARSAGVSGATR